MKYTGVGRVHPERASVYISTIATMSEHGLVNFRCDASQIFITIDLPKVTDVRSAHATMEHIAQTYVNALAFGLACGYTAEITHVADSNQNFVIGVQEESLVFADKEFELVVTGAVDLALDNIFFRFAVQDYTKAITDYIDCPYLCYRAIESLSKSFGQDKDKSNWAAMHAALGTSRDSIDKHIKPFADVLRHGRWEKAGGSTHEQRIEALKVTRDFLLRYMGYHNVRLE